jgi:benzylsuccinate CoA-transferase BbsF subunit
MSERSPGDGRRTFTEPPAATSLPLAGIRVLNLGWIWAGPAAGHALGDFGADVIKVESNERVDYTRKGIPIAHGVENACIFGFTTYRNQRSVSVNFAHAEAPDLIRRLAATSDVLIENFRAGFLARKGLSYEELEKLNPKLVYVSLTPAGDSGPWASMGAYGPTVSAFSGLDSLQGYGEHPESFTTSFTDPIVGVYAATIAAAAVLAARRTGKGCHISLAQTEVMAHMLAGPFLRYQATGEDPVQLFNRHPVLAPHGIYPCAGDDRWIAIAAPDEAAWRSLCGVLAPPLAADARFRTMAHRKAKEAELNAAISDQTCGRDREQLVAELQARGVAATPVLSAEEVFEHAHYESRGDWVRVPYHGHSTALYTLPWKLSRTPGRIRRVMPALGEHNDEVFLGLLGVSEAEYARLQAVGAIR